MNAERKNQERRENLRIFFVTSLVLTAGFSQRITGKTVDISAGGFRFRSFDVLNVGDPISGQMYFPNSRPYLMEGRVTYRQIGNPHTYGVSFTRAFIETLLEDWMRG